MLNRRLVIAMLRAFELRVGARSKTQGERLDLTGVFAAVELENMVAMDIRLKPT